MSHNATHHLHILHGLMALKIEGTSPHNLTFNFGPSSRGDERSFLKYVNGRKVLKTGTMPFHKDKRHRFQDTSVNVQEQI